VKVTTVHATACREIDTKSAQTRHHFADTVLGAGGGPTPRPWVGAETASAGFDTAWGGIR